MLSPQIKASLIRGLWLFVLAFLGALAAGAIGNDGKVTPLIWWIALAAGITALGGRVGREGYLDSRRAARGEIQESDVGYDLATGRGDSYHDGGLVEVPSPPVRLGSEYENNYPRRRPVPEPTRGVALGAMASREREHELGHIHWDGTVDRFPIRQERASRPVSTADDPPPLHPPQE